MNLLFFTDFLLQCNKKVAIFLDLQNKQFLTTKKKSIRKKKE